MTAPEQEFLAGLADEIAAKVLAGLKPEAGAETFLSAQQIAAKYSVDPRTVRGWIESKRLPSKKIGGARRVAKVDLDAFIKDGA